MSGLARRDFPRVLWFSSARKLEGLERFEEFWELFLVKWVNYYSFYKGFMITDLSLVLSYHSRCLIASVSLVGD